MILPGATLGILGGGQLGRMLAIPARQLGYRVAVLAPEGDAPAFGVADHVIRAAFEDQEAVGRLAAISEVVTYEFENVAAETVRRIEARVPVRPGAELLAATQDRLLERALCQRAGAPVAPFREVDNREGLSLALTELGGPLRLKTARGGYDGGGQWRIRDEADAEALFRNGPPVEGRFLAEKEVNFETEVSVILCRDVYGDTRIFPLFENHHEGGILALTRCPARISAARRSEIEDLAVAFADTVGLVGTLTVELFVTARGVLVNELAPRVHNSGHLTVEACTVSQFEQHLRAVCGLPLRPAELRKPAAMVNLLGTEELRFIRLEGVESALRDPGASLHLYGKRHCRPRRKMGHLTVVGDDPDEVVSRARAHAETMRFVKGGS